MSRQASHVVWRRLHWRRPIQATAVSELLRLWAVDPRSPRIALEVRTGEDAIKYLLGVDSEQLASITAALTQAVPGTRVTSALSRPPITAAAGLRLTSRARALRASDPDAVVRAVVGALSRVHENEQLVLQVILGSRLSATPVPSSPSATPPGITPGFLHTRHGDDREARTARRLKQSEPGFGCVIRLGVNAGDEARQRSLVASLLRALRSVEAPGVRLRLVRQPARQLNEASSPWLWPLALNIDELTGLLAWPLGDGDLPGIPSVHPVLLPPHRQAASTSDRVIGTATAPGYVQPIGLNVEASLRHTWLLGPNGTGKSTLLLNLLTQDVQSGRGVVLIEPKGDLVEALLARIPAARLSDVVLLDPLDAVPVGLNPLAGDPTSSQVRVEGLLAVFRALFADSWGPRTQDILSASLLTLTRRGDASLVMVPLLLTNPGFRHSITQSVVHDDPLALGAFWRWYEALSNAERGAVIAPVMNKVRVFLTNPRLRAVIGQRSPRFQMAEVLRQNKILLVPLRKGTLGSDTAQLLGSLVVAELWQATLSRPLHQRRPVLVTIDEVQDYLHLPTDLGDALAQARGLGVGFTVANQFVDQVPRSLRAGFLSNIRSRVCFQLAAHDARLMAEGHPELTANDLTSLGAFEVYASLVSDHRSMPYVSGRTLPAPRAVSNPDDVRLRSRQTYGQALSDIEREFAELLDSPASPPDASSSSGRRRRS